MIIKNKNPRHFWTPQIPQILTSRNTNQSTSSGGAQSVPIPPAVKWLLQLQSIWTLDKRHVQTQGMVVSRSSLGVWLMFEWCLSPSRLGWLWTTTCPSNAGCAGDLSQQPGEALPIQRDLKRPFLPPSKLICTCTRLLEVQYVTAHCMLNHRSGLSLRYQQCIAKIARNRVIPDVHKDTQQEHCLDCVFAQLPNNRKENQNLTFLRWKSDKALEQAAQGSNGLARPTAKASFKVLWCQSFAEKSERKRNLLTSDHWIGVLQRDLHGHRHTQRCCLMCVNTGI